MKFTELKLKIQQDLVDHPELSTFLNERMTRDYPELKPETFETDEHSESIYYGLRNDMFLTIMNDVLSGMSSIDEE